MCLHSISQNHHFQITRLEGELIKNEEEILSLKQSLVDKKDTITSKESEIVQIKSEMNHQGEQHKAFVQVTLTFSYADLTLSHCNIDIFFVNLVVNLGTVCLPNFIEADFF